MLCPRGLCRGSFNAMLLNGTLPMAKSTCQSGRRVSASDSARTSAYRYSVAVTAAVVGSSSTPISSAVSGARPMKVPAPGYRRPCIDATRSPQRVAAPHLDRGRAGTLRRRPPHSCLRRSVRGAVRRQGGQRRSIEQTLDLAWRLLARFPASELRRIGRDSSSATTSRRCDLVWSRRHG
jgi:hypothetical protein